MKDCRAHNWGLR